jgi:hypothetical protein
MPSITREGYDDSYGLWERRFGADPPIVGESVTLNGHPFTDIGVAPKGFTGTNTGIASELWAPMMMTAKLIPGRT